MNGPEFLIPIAFFVTVASIVRMVLQHKERRLDRESHFGAVGAGSDARLERMEQAIDAMALELERISEAQRFTTRLLSEQAAAQHAALPNAARQMPS